MIALTWNEIINKEFHDGRFGKALQDGFFYVEIPESIRPKIESVKQFANHIRENEVLKTAQLGPRLGYQERQGPQTAAFSAMNHQWQQVFPEHVVDVAEEMNHIALEILKAALGYLTVPETVWSEATGQLTEGKGSNVFTFNHYEPGNQKIGLIPHKDMGWITVLCLDKMGLQTSVDGKQWENIPPKEGYCVINFGRAFEILINATDKLRASMHRVEITEPRVSFGLFINHTEGSSMYQIDDKQNLVKSGTYEQYLEKCFAEFQALQEQLSGK